MSLEENSVQEKRQTRGIYIEKSKVNMGEEWDGVEGCIFKRNDQPLVEGGDLTVMPKCAQPQQVDDRMDLAEEESERENRICLAVVDQNVIRPTLGECLG